MGERITSTSMFQEIQGRGRPGDNLVAMLQEQMAYPVLEASPMERSAGVLRYIEQESRYKMFVVAEGPPLYLWPALPSHEWDSQAFINGWKIVNSLTGRIPAEKLRHYVLVDDMNYRPKGVGEDIFSEKTIALWQSSHAMRSSPIFQQNDTTVKRFSELDLAVEVGSTACSVLDAAFNAKKITDHMRGSGPDGLLYPENLDKLLLLVVGPNGGEIRAEQLNMIQALYERLKKQPQFQRTSKENIRQAICAMYRHVWLDRNGNPREVTKPIYANNKFVLKTIL